MKKVLRYLLIFIILAGIGVLSFLCWGIYDEGIRAGTVVRISKKGVVWKTYEGQLSLQAFGALKNVNPLAETFDFSVEKDCDSIVRLLETAAITGERVSLRYIKRYVILPWRGKTKYFVVGVERGPNPGPPAERNELFGH